MPTISSSEVGGVGGAVGDIFAGIGDQYKAEGAQLEGQSYREAAQLALQNEQFTAQSTAIVPPRPRIP